MLPEERRLTESMERELIDETLMVFLQDDLLLIVPQLSLKTPIISQFLNDSIY